MSTSRTALRYEQGSGQVFFELISQARKDSDWNWLYKARGQLPGRVPRDTDGSPPSLQEVALHSILKNLSCMTQEILSKVPCHLVITIWRRIQLCELDSLHLWMLFLTALKDEKEFYSASEPHSPGHKANTEPVLSRLSRHERPALRLPEYIDRISSDSFTWVTRLTITTLGHMGQDVVSLSKLNNLEYLNITLPSSIASSDDRSIVGDRLVRLWNDAARERNAFPVLQNLLLRYHARITKTSFEFLNHFKSLLYYDVLGSSVLQSDQNYAKELGWDHETSSDVLQPGTSSVRGAAVLRFCLGFHGTKSPQALGQFLFRRRDRIATDLASVPSSHVITDRSVAQSRASDSEAELLQRAPIKKRRKMRQSKSQALEGVVGDLLGR